MIASLQVPFETGPGEAEHRLLFEGGSKRGGTEQGAIQCSEWYFMGNWEGSGKEGKKAQMGLASTGTFYSKDSPVLSRERRTQGKERETELLKLLSYLWSWDSFSKEGGLLGPKDTQFSLFSSPHLRYVCTITSTATPAEESELDEEEALQVLCMSPSLSQLRNFFVSEGL